MIQTTRPPIRVGIVGLGRAGFETHCAELDMYPHLFKVVAACDPLKERRDAIVARYPDCHVCRGLELLLKNLDVDLVDVATRSDDHLSHVVAALKTQKWVHVESPFCCDYEQALLLRAAAIKSGNRLLVRNPYHFEAAFQQARAMAESPLLGEVYSIKMRRGSYERRDDWQVIMRCGGGIALSQGAAFLGQALELLKSQPVKVWADFKRVVAVGDAEDYFRILLRNLAGLTVDLEVSGGRIREEPLFVVTGSRGEYSVMPGASEGRLRYLDPDKPLERRRSSLRIPPLNSEVVPETFHWKEATLPLNRDPKTDLTQNWEHVYNTVRENKPYPVSFDHAVEIMQLLALAKKDTPFA